MKFSESKEHLKCDDSSDPAMLQNRCGKFNPFFKNNADCKRAVIFMKLLKAGCPKFTAMHFSAKNVCRMDSTKVIDGPEKFRVLKVKPMKNLTHNGWLFDTPIYDIGKDYYQSTKDFLKKDDQEDLLHKHFIINENKIREDFKKKIKTLADYYKNLNDEYGFTNLTDQDLYKKVKNLSEKNHEKNKNGKHFVKLGDARFYNVGAELYEEKSKPDRFNIINDLNIFPIAGNAYDQKLAAESEEEESDFEGEKENPSSLLPNTKSNKSLSSARKLFASSRISRMQYINSKDPAEIEKIKRRSTVFYDLEVQTQYLNTIANIENMMDHNSYSNMEMKLLNKKSQSPPPVQKRDKDQMMSENFGKETQKLIEEEFNKSKYVVLSHKPGDRNSTIKNSRDNSPLAFKFKRKSYLSEAICKEDLSDPVLFEYALRKITHTHIEKLNTNRVGSGQKVDTRALDEIKKLRKQTQDHYLNRTQSSESKFRKFAKSRPLSKNFLSAKTTQESMIKRTLLTSTSRCESKNFQEKDKMGFSTARTGVPDFITSGTGASENSRKPHIRVKTAF